MFKRVVDPTHDLGAAEMASIAVFFGPLRALLHSGAVKVDGDGGEEGCGDKDRTGSTVPPHHCTGGAKDRSWDTACEPVQSDSHPC